MAGVRGPGVTRQRSRGRDTTLTALLGGAARRWLLPVWQEIAIGAALVFAVVLALAAIVVSV